MIDLRTPRSPTAATRSWKQIAREGKARRRLRKQLFSIRPFESLESRNMLAGDLGISLDFSIGACVATGLDSHAADEQLSTGPFEANSLSITQADVERLADAAIARWVESGVTPEQHAALEQLTYVVSNLSDQRLGEYDSGVITLDDDGASHLWFVDSTPLLDEEFSSLSETSFAAKENTMAWGKMDLLTAIMHEQGHALGLEGVLDVPSDLLNEELAADTRRLPTLGQSENAIPGSLAQPAYLTSASTGSGQPHSTMQPYLTLNYAISVAGTYPSRSLSSASYLGAVELFAADFAPTGYALAQGQLLLVSQNPTLFSILGVKYGGDGRTNFALPDLRGRVPIGAGNGPGLQDYALGQKGGGESVSLDLANLRSHTHTLANATVSTVGGDQSFENRQPYLALTPLIATSGQYPSRNLSSNDLLGSVSWFAGDFAPPGFSLASGQLLSVAENAALFSLLLTTYGGDGRTTFGLPDLRGRAVIGAGNGPGLSAIALGQKGGTETVIPTFVNLPSHLHQISNFATTDNTGGSQRFENHQPFLGLNYAISVSGLFPSEDLGVSEAGVVPEDASSAFVSGNQKLDKEDALELIEPLYATAIRFWQAAGISETQVERLKSVRLEIADLESGRLASAGFDVITLDHDASGRGWFIDTTPEEHSEFAELDRRTGEMVSTQHDVARHYDLLTAILHEQGHILGLHHADIPGGVMYGGLGVGGRLLPTESDLVLTEHEHAEEQFLEASDPFIASVGIFAGNFAPRSWALTEGQLQQISQNSALFSLLRTTYGGNGLTTFGLPDLRGRVAIGEGSGQDLTQRNLGSKGGTETVTLTVGQIPGHTHEVKFTPEIDGTTEDDVFKVYAENTQLIVELNEAEVFRQEISDVVSVTLNGLGGDDVFDVNHAGGVVTIPIIANGGEQSTKGDSLNVAGGSFATAEYTFTTQNEQGNDGSVDLGGASITFTGLEPLISTVVSENAVFHLPNVPNSDVTLRAPTTGESGDLALVGGTFESTFITTPSISLTIFGGSDVDELTIDIDPGIDTTLNFAETINLNVDITGAVVGDADTVNVAAPGSIQDALDAGSGVGLVDVAAGNYDETVNGTANSMRLRAGATVGIQGAVSAIIVGDTGSTITATGDLALGDLATASGFATDGLIETNGNTVALLSSDASSAGDVDLGNGGVLKADNGVQFSSGDTVVGTGTIDGPAIFLDGAESSPGSSAGIIVHDGDLDLRGGAILTVELGGSVAGSGYDQVDVLGNLLLSVDGPELNASLSFLPDVGTEFVIVDVDGTSSGSFNGLSEGSKFVLSDSASGATVGFKISYTGGSGNDIVLTVVRPSTVFVDDNFANPVLGADPDGTGPATIFGFDSFATIQEGLAAVGPNGEVIVNAGSYGGAVSVSDARTLRLVTDAGVTIESLAGDSSASVDLQGSAELTVGDASNSDYFGTLTGGGSLKKVGSGQLTLYGSNTYSGTTSIEAGALWIEKSSGLGTSTAGTTVEAGAELYVFGNATIDEPLTLKGELAVGAPASSGTFVNWNGPISVSGGTAVLEAAQPDDELTISGVISGTDGISVDGDGATIFTNLNSYSGPTTALSGTLVIGTSATTTASITSNVSVAAPAKLIGTGTVNGNVDGGGLFSPTMRMNINGDFTPTGIVEFLVNRTFASPGTDYDQYVINGSVDLNRAEIQFQQITDAAVTELPMMTLIDNQSTDYGTTASTNPEAGETITIGNAFYQLNYNAGSNSNDVVLTQVGGISYDPNTEELTVTGSDQQDSFRIQESSPGVVEVRGSFGDVGSARLIPSGNVSKITAILYDGNDVADIRANISTIVLGGAGNDSLRMSGGVGILIGGSGQDSLRGNDRSVILIGGTEDDRLIGSSQQDILVGGSTANEDNLPALELALDDLALGHLNEALIDLGLSSDDFAIDDMIGRGGLDELLTGAGDRSIQ